MGVVPGWIIAPSFLVSFFWVWRDTEEFCVFVLSYLGHGVFGEGWGVRG